MFAGDKDNYSVSHGRGIGPVWVPLEAKFKDDRGAFGFHNDENAPGTEGCVGLVNLAELKKFVAALREFDPHTLDVQWGL
jgi:lysozyme